MIDIFGPLAVMVSLAQASALPATDNFSMLNDFEKRLREKARQ